MINVSSAFREKLKNGGSCVNYADITLGNGRIMRLEPKDFMIGGCTITDATTDGNSFSVGNTVGKSISLRIANHDGQFSGYDFYNAVVYLYVGMVLDDGTVEKIRKGKYYVNEPESPGDVIELNAVDGMVNFDRSYEENKTSYPASLQTILTDACMECGVAVGFRQFDNYTFTVAEKPAGATYRQIVSWTAQIAGYNARMSNEDKLELIPYAASMLDEIIDGGYYRQEDTGTPVDGGLFTDKEQAEILDGGLFTDPVPENLFQWKSLTVATDDVVITGVKVTDGEKDYLYGSEDYAVVVEDNPLVKGKEQEVADYLGKRLDGIRFRPFTGQVRCNPLYEPMDVCDVYDRKNNIYRSVINSVEFTIGSCTTLSCQAEAPLRNGSVYHSEAARAAVAARRETEKKLSTYEQKAEQMNELSSNAMGYHTTVEELPDGSVITYLHDKPVLAESKTVYKQTVDGFFISNDGGKTFTLGFDKDGNAVMNILAAIGIVADWIKGGTLVLGGDNNVDGICSVVDAEGKEVVRLDKNGLTTHSANITGGTINIHAEDGISVISLVSDTATTYMYTGHMALASHIPEQKEIICDYSYDGIMLNSSNYHIRTGIKMGDIEIHAGGIKFGNSALISTVMASLFGWNISSTSISKTGISLGTNTSDFKMISTDGISAWGSGIDVKTGGMRVSGGLKIVTGTLDSYTCSLGNVTASTLRVTGSKSRIVKTENYSDRLLYCYEMPKPYFGDTGEATLDESGLCYVFVDDIFLETINTECSYQVFLQKYDPGDLWVKSREPTYFVVEGTPNLTFTWEVKARQAGFEVERLEVYTAPETEASVDYEQEASNYVQNYYKEMLDYEESNQYDGFNDSGR